MPQRLAVVLLACLPFLEPRVGSPKLTPRASLSAAPPPVGAVFASEPARFAHVGVDSCASTACHNRPTATSTTGAEYARALQDRHSRSFLVLLTERSRQIERLYHGLGPGDVHPERDVLCLKCHVHPEIGSPGDHVRRVRLEDGVSCETCHGPASGWLDRHHRADWRRLSASDKARRFGMNDLRDLPTRIRTCIPCHVGQPGMEVNHDLIAAGHPRLAFEFSGYHALLTRHWDEGRDRDPARGGRADFEFRAWATGRLLTLDASLTLLEHRRQQGPWPEFAEYDCFACHHDLLNPGQKQTRTFVDRKAGGIPWGSWYSTGMESPLLLGKPGSEKLDAVRAAMLGPRPHKDRVADALGTAAVTVRGATPARHPAKPIREVMAALLPTPSLEPLSWDDAAQLHAALRSLEATRLDTGEPEIPGLREGLMRLGRRLDRFRREQPPGLLESLGDIRKSLVGWTDPEGKPWQAVPPGP